MSPTPGEVRRGYSSERLDTSGLRAQAECARILYNAVEEAKASLGGNPTRLVGLIFDGKCIHPLIEEEIIWGSMASTCNYALGGRDFSELFTAGITDKGISVNWKREDGAASLYAYCKEGSGLNGNVTSLNIWTKEGLMTEGVLFFPRDMVNRGYSPERLLELSKVVVDHASFVPVYRALLKARGLN